MNAKTHTDSVGAGSYTEGVIIEELHSYLTAQLYLTLLLVPYIISTLTTRAVTPLRKYDRRR